MTWSVTSWLRPPTPRKRSSWIGRGASWIGNVRRARAFASVSSRIARRPGSTSSSSPGPSRPRRTVSAAVNGTAPASDATATSRSRVTAKAAGRSPFRSTSAPTDRPSAKTIAAGPSHGARNPAVRRRSVATCGCGARRRASASGIAVSSAAVRSQPVAVSSSSAFVERERVGAVLGQQRTGVEERPRDRGRGGIPGSPADLLAIAADRVDLAVVRDRAERLGEPPDRPRVRRVALVEDRVGDGQRRPQVRVEVGQPAADDQALVDDGPRRRRRHGDLGERATGSTGGRLEPSPRDDEPPLEGVVGEGPRVRSERDGRATIACTNAGPRRRRGRTQRIRVAGHRTPRDDRQPLPGEDVLDQSARPGLDRPTPWQEQRHDARPLRGQRRRPAAPAPTGRAAAPPRRRRSTPRRPRTPRDARATPARRGPAAAPGPATARRPRPRRTRRRTRRARSARRTGA